MLAQVLTSALKDHLKEMHDFREKLFEDANFNKRKYSGELLSLSGLIGTIEAIIELSEKNII